MPVRDKDIAAAAITLLAYQRSTKKDPGAKCPLKKAFAALQLGLIDGDRMLAVADNVLPKADMYEARRWMLVNIRDAGVDCVINAFSNDVRFAKCAVCKQKPRQGLIHAGCACWDQCTCRYTVCCRSELCEECSDL